MKQRAPGQDWMSIVRHNGTAAFGQAFAPHVTLEASVLNGRCVGVAAIASFFAATSGGPYETIAFTHETTAGLKTYLEWQGTAFGKPVRGTTMLTRTRRGQLEHIQLYHRPLPVVVAFAQELAKPLEAESRSGVTACEVIQERSFAANTLCAV